MKKFNILISILLIIFTLTSCGKTEEPTEALTSNAQTTVTTALPTSTTVPESNLVIATTETTSQSTTTTETTTVVTTSVATTQSTTAFITAEATTAKPTTIKQQTTTKLTTITPTATEKQTTSKVTTTKPNTTDPITTKPVTTTKQTTTKPTTTVPTTQSTTAAKNYCTVRIECDTIYDNLSKLKSGKKDFLPSSGVILNNVQVEITGNESAFDVIKKACEENVCTDNCKYCKASGVQIEYTYTPAFNNYYIEGIHQIYEKDCGTQSGWMYNVNGNFPDEGSSSYTVLPGDVIVFSFTCNMGEDIGNTY